MRWQPKQLWAFLLLMILSMLTAQPILAQDDDGDGDGDGDIPPPATGGVLIDADGYLTKRAFVDRSGRLTRKRLESARATVNRDLQKPSQLRKVSLIRLEKQVRALIDAGKPIPEDMLYMAGLTRISHVFYYPENNDIVIAGPAEGYFRTGENRVVGMTTGQATMQLQDMVVALRAFGPDGKSTPFISCSIDPTQEGLARLNKAVRSITSAQPNQTRAIANLFSEALGYQTVTIQGVSPKTHFAQVLVEADYDMKLIGIGIQQPAVRIISFIEAANASSARNLQRWYFQPNYDNVTISEDRQSMAIKGSGVKLVGEGEQVGRQGKRKRTGRVSGASQKFTRSFTEQYDNLAKVSTLYGELRNVIDMSIVAAFIQKMGLFEQSGWTMETFGDESIAPVENFVAPTKVDPVVNAVWKGRSLMTPIGGGVSIQPRVALNSDRVKVDTAGEIDKVKQSLSFDDLRDDQWWWD